MTSTVCLPPLISLFLSNHDGKLSSTRSNRAYLQCFPQSFTQRGPRHNHCDDLRRTTEMKTFFDLSSWGPGFWGSGTRDLLMQYPYDPTDKSLSEAFINFLLHWDPKTWSNSGVTFSEKPPVITVTTAEEILRVKRSEGSSSCSESDEPSWRDGPILAPGGPSVPHWGGRWVMVPPSEAQTHSTWQRPA